MSRVSGNTSLWRCLSMHDRALSLLSFSQLTISKSKFTIPICNKLLYIALTWYNQDDLGILGHLVQFLQEPWGFPLVRWQETVATSSSGFYRIFMGPSDYLVPMNPKALAAIMNDPNTFAKTAAVREGFVATLGHGVVSTEGAVHRVSMPNRTASLQ